MPLRHRPSLISNIGCRFKPKWLKNLNCSSPQIPHTNQIAQNETSILRSHLPQPRRNNAPVPSATSYTSLPPARTTSKHLLPTNLRSSENTNYASTASVVLTRNLIARPTTTVLCLDAARCTMLRFIPSINPHIAPRQLLAATTQVSPPRIAIATSVNPALTLRNFSHQTIYKIAAVLNHRTARKVPISTPPL